MLSLKRGVRVEGEEAPMRPERAWFLSEGEKSEGRMGADFPRRGKSACDESSTLTPVTEIEMLTPFINT
jgi:hypothetical protein